MKPNDSHVPTQTIAGFTVFDLTGSQEFERDAAAAADGACRGDILLVGDDRLAGRAETALALARKTGVAEVAVLCELAVGTPVRVTAGLCEGSAAALVGRAPVGGGYRVITLDKGPTRVKEGGFVIIPASEALFPDVIAPEAEPAHITLEGPVEVRYVLLARGREMVMLARLLTGDRGFLALVEPSAAAPVVVMYPTREEACERFEGLLDDAEGQGWSGVYDGRELPDRHEGIFEELAAAVRTLHRSAAGDSPAEPVAPGRDAELPPSRRAVLMSAADNNPCILSLSLAGGDGEPRVLTCTQQPGSALVLAGASFDSERAARRALARGRRQAESTEGGGWVAFYAGPPLFG